MAAPFVLVGGAIGRGWFVIGFSLRSFAALKMTNRAVRLRRRGCRRCGTNARDLRQRRVVHRVALLAPSVEPALQWANLLDALFAQQNRELRARRFVRASAIQDDLTVARQLVVFLAQF